MTFAFRDVRYWVPLPGDQAPPGGGQAELQLLCGISGVFSPGVLVCLMGESGAGKTTLLDVLANRCDASCVCVFGLFLRNPFSP